MGPSTHLAVTLDFLYCFFLNILADPIFQASPLVIRENSNKLKLEFWVKLKLEFYVKLKLEFYVKLKLEFYVKLKLEFYVKLKLKFYVKL